MRMSDLLNGVGNVLQIADTADLGARWLGGIVRGKEPPPSDSENVKGWSGVFGPADEIKFTRLMMQLTEAERETIVKFLDFAFPSGRTRVERFAHWRYTNAFRNYVVNLGRGPDKDISTVVSETTTVGPQKGEKTVERTTTLNKEAGTNHALKFLQWMAATIPSLGRSGNQKMLHQLRIMGVPLIPEDAGEILRDMKESSESWLDETNRSLENTIQEHIDNQGPLRRLYERLLG
jgi:hypothetical protein